MTLSTLQELTLSLVADGVSRDKILTNYWKRSPVSDVFYDQLGLNV
jgi:hypothetical protein